MPLRKVRIKMTKREFRVPSCDKVHTLAGVIYLPDTPPKGYFHIVHGMTEYIKRYENIMRDLTEEGYICFGYDNLGHGHTVNDEAELGFIAHKGGDELICRDVKVFSDAVMAEYGALPYYLMGHSMGSFITRLAVEKYVKPDKYICMGTGGKNAAAGAGLALIALVKLFKGDRYISVLVDKLAFGNYNKHFEEGNPAAWLTRDAEMVKKYREDRLCSFKFTVSAMGDLVRLNKRSNSASWYKNMPKDLPVLLVAGECDPVGNYGKGVREVCEKLKKHGCDARAILYPDARHEILNDLSYNEVKQDIIGFLK